MAEISPQTVKNFPGQGATVWAWRDVRQGDTCLPLEVPIKADKTVQVKPSKVAGAFDGATVHLDGTLEAVPAAGDYDVLESAGTGAALSFTAADTKAILQHTLWVVPRLETPGVNTKVDVLVMAVGRRD